MTTDIETKALFNVLRAAGKMEVAEHVNQASHLAVKNLVSRFLNVVNIPGVEHTNIPGWVRKMMLRAIDRDIYSVRLDTVFWWDGQEIKELRGGYIGENGKRRMIYRRPYIKARAEIIKREDGTLEQEITGEPVFHVEFKASRNQRENSKTLWKMQGFMKERGWEFLGTKAKGPRPTAVFIKGDSIEEALRNVIGEELAHEILRKNDLKLIQNLVILLCRVGWRVKRAGDWKVDDMGWHVKKGLKWDGVMMGLNQEASRMLKKAFLIPDDTRLAFGTYLDEHVGTKGGILLNQENNYTCPETVKLGRWGDGLDMKKLVLHDIDSLSLPENRKQALDYQETDTETRVIGGVHVVRLNLPQEFIYNYSLDEQEALVNKVFVPAMRQAGSNQAFRSLRDVDRLLALECVIPGEIDLAKIRDRRRARVMRECLGATIPGFYVPVAPGVDLKPFQIIIPREMKKEGYKKGDLVDCTRHPSLPVGNSTQRYQIVGYTWGKYAKVGRAPWMTIQGGDYDGDLVRVTKRTVELFPDKEWDQTPMSEIRTPTTKRTGVRPVKKRINQANTVLGQAIGIYDFCARQAWEIGRLTDGVRKLMAKNIQANVDMAKKNVHIQDMRHITRRICPRRDKEGRAINYMTRDIRNSAKKGVNLNMLIKLTEHLPGGLHHRLFSEAKEIIEQKAPERKLNINKLKEIAAQIPEEDSFNEREWKEIRAEGLRLARITNIHFNRLARNRQPNLAFLEQADELSVQIQSYSNKIALGGIQDLSLTSLQELEGIQYRLNRRSSDCIKYLLLNLCAHTRWRAVCRLSIPGWESIAHLALDA